MPQLLEILLHLDEKLITGVQAFGPWIYLVLFLVVFCETGLIIFPFLPGDSLLFAAGLVSNPDHQAMNIWAVTATFVAAAIIGDSVNFAIGKFVGDKLFRHHKNPLLNKMFKQSHLDAARRYFDKYGARTVIIGRFVPIIRTLTPFVAGQTMEYPRFLKYSVAGTLIWVGICTWGGYLFGQIPIVKENFSTTLLIVAGGTILLGLLEIWRSSRHKEVPETPAA